MKVVLGVAATSLVLGCASPPPPSSEPPKAAHGGGHGHGHGHGHHGQGMQHGFGGADGWAKVFDAEDRDGWQRPDEVLAASGIGADPKAVVADVGAGTGYFSVKVARRVPAGKVFAVDVEPDMVRYLRERAAREGLTNVTAVQATADDPKIPELVDVILIVDTLHHIGARGPYFAKLRASLRPGGRVVVVDFHREATMGPPKEHRLSVDEIVADAAGAGLVKRSEARLPQQYVLVLGAP